MIPRNLNNEPDDSDDECLEKLQKEFKRDQKYIEPYPEEWDKLFHAAMEHGKKKRIWQKRIKAAAMAASVLLLVGIVGMVQYKQVYGGNLKDWFEMLFSESKYGHNIQGTDSDTEITLEETEFSDTFFYDTTLDSLQQSIRNEIKRPMFYYADVFKDYEISEAKYSHTFQLLTITLKTDDGFIYLYQNNSYRNTGNGVFFENEPITKVYNPHLQQDIFIYESMEESDCQGYAFKVNFNNCYLIFQGAITLDACKNFASNMYYE